MTQTCYKVNVLDRSMLAKVIVPANNIFFFHVRLLDYAVIQDHDAIFPLDFANVRLGNSPQIS